jgi:lysophospholipase L1-like esterase
MRRAVLPLVLSVFVALSTAGRAVAADCTNVSTGLVPIIDLGTGTYKGMPGGLYGNGANAPPAAHLANGLRAAGRIVPRAANGSPSNTGRIVLISIGMSNTTQEFTAFQALVQQDARVSPSLVTVDGAQGGVTASEWADPMSPAWTELARRLKAARVTPAQVQAAWVKLANRADSTPTDIYRAQLERDWITVIRNLRDRFPNLQIAYQSSRIYAGYASTLLNPEPYAYESGFVVKRVIQRQIDGQLAGRPWLAWGPYLWADGLVPRSDGLTWQCSDFQDDGTHPSTTGRRKVAERLLEFFESDDTAAWFLR